MKFDTRSAHTNIFLSVPVVQLTSKTHQNGCTGAGVVQVKGAAEGY